MEYICHSHRHGLTLFENAEPFATLWGEIGDAITEISEERIIERFDESARVSKSISAVVNSLLHEGLVARGWDAESAIFADQAYSVRRESRWRLDFAKGEVSVEVAFNHGEAAAWNLLKPVLASELNHVRKAIQTRAGVIITATEEMKIAGGFDSAVGTYEKYVQYLRPLNNVLTVPILVIGLLAPRTFEIAHFEGDGKKRGTIRRRP